MAFRTRRHLSRQGNVAKRLNEGELAEAVASEIEQILLRHDPSIRKPAVLVASRLGGAIAASIAVQTQVVQRSLSSVQEDVASLAADFVQKVKAIANETGGSEATVPAVMTPIALLSLPDDWAGPVAGPTLLERRYGLARSTLFRWMKRGEVISLRTSGNRPVFPLSQFIDGRPADGIPELISIFGDSRRAWQWLVAPCAELGDERPIDELLAGKDEQVCQIARLIP